jgi:hypothetical protein
MVMTIKHVATKKRIRIILENLVKEIKPKVTSISMLEKST